MSSLIVSDIRIIHNHIRYLQIPQKMESKGIKYKKTKKTPNDHFDHINMLFNPFQNHDNGSKYILYMNYLYKLTLKIKICHFFDDTYYSKSQH